MDLNEWQLLSKETSAGIADPMRGELESQEAVIFPQLRDDAA